MVLFNVLVEFILEQSGLQNKSTTETLALQSRSPTWTSDSQRPGSPKCVLWVIVLLKTSTTTNRAVSLSAKQMGSCVSAELIKTSPVWTLNIAWHQTQQWTNCAPSSAQLWLQLVFNRFLFYFLMTNDQIRPQLKYFKPTKYLELVFPSIKWLFRVKMKN